MLDLFSVEVTNVVREVNKYVNVLYLSLNAHLFIKTIDNNIYIDNGQLQK
jgi:hypothetical protein